MLDRRLEQYDRHREQERAWNRELTTLALTGVLDEWILVEEGLDLFDGVEIRAEEDL